MASTIPQLVEWLEQDEAKTRIHRAYRLQKLLEATQTPDSGIVFSGGLESAQAYQEMRLAYLHGLYLSTVLIGLACIERELAGRLYAIGWPDARAKFELLIHEAFQRRVISADDVRDFNKLRAIRNAYAHFRKPLDATAWTGRAMSVGFSHDDVLSEDAALAITAVESLLNQRM